MRTHIAVLLLFQLLLCTGAKADNIRRISSREGISNNSVLSIAQGHDGYIWFGTCDGLDLWDGEKAVSYPSEDGGMLSLSGNLIEEIISTKDSLFWVRTNYGFDLFGPEGVRARHEEFQGIYFAASRNSYETFVFAPGDELYGYRPSTRDFVKTAWPGDFTFNDILDISITDENVAWIFCRSGIYYAGISFPHDGGAAKMDRAGKAAGSIPLVSAFRKDGGAYVIDTGGTLYFFNTDNGQLTTVADLKADISRYGPVSDIVKYSDGYMVSFLYNGVTRLTRSPDSNGSMYRKTRLDIDCGVFSLLRDRRQDIVWIGTDGQGVMMYASNPTTFMSYTFDRLPYSLSKPVRAFLADSKGTLWIGTKGEGILRIPKFTNGGRITASGARHITTANSALSDESVYAFAESRSGVIWIGSEGKGIDYYSYKSGKIHALGGNIPEDLRYVHGFCEDGSTLWVATVGRGVYRLEIGNGPDGPYVKEGRHLDFGEEMRNMDMFFCVYKDSDGSLLFGNRGGGLAVYDPVKESARVLKFNNGRSDIANDVWTICRSVKGDLWIGTSYGLIKVSIEDGTVEETSIKKSVHGILEGKYGELWISTNKGLIKYIPANDKSIVYGYSYGVNTIEYSDGAYFSDSTDSLLFFGGTNGFVTVDSRQDTGNAIFPDLILRKVRISGPESSGDRTLSWGRTLTVKAQERLHEIDVDALDYIDGNNYLFYYMLKGFDRTWYSTSKTIRMPDLSPGKYTLLVKYYNPVVGYSSPESGLEIRIKPRWYASTMARVLYVLLSIYMLYFVADQYRKYKNRKYLEQQEKMEARRKEELFDSTVQLFENIAHELTMPVTMISGPCQQILEYEKSDSFIRQHGEKILQHSGKLLGMLRMFQNFSESGDSEQGYVQMFNVSDMAEEITGTFMHHAEDRKISFTRSIPENIVWNTAYREVSTIIEMLLTNAFINVEKNGKVDFRIWTEDNMLKISISNNGKEDDAAEIAGILEKTDAREYPLNGKLPGLSFNNEMRLVVCRNIAAKLGGTLTLGCTEDCLGLTLALPAMEIQENRGMAENAVEKYSGYANMHEGNRIDNAEMYKEQLLDFDVDQERATMYITGTDHEIMNFVAELFTSRYNIRMFNDCNAALLATHNTQPDIMIFEYLTRRDDVLDTIKAVKEDKVTSNIPILLLSGERHTDDKVKAIESGADIYIGLPLDIKYLRASVEQLINKLKTLQDYYQSSISSYQFTYGKMLHREDKEFIDRMLKIISENISDSTVTTAFIAEEMGVSVRTLYNRLEGLINVTPNNIIKEFRLAYAEQLLSTTKLTIDEIIFKSGYANRGTFFKNFSAKYGCTPKAYREKLNNI